ncbi:ABC transporter ATP-binding protein [Brevibacillus laterosporus]|uniref:ABC transporter ATP-binding protein n=1 Tax=Brevibacillus laterosporus TaxID=1465 RepID=UPI000379E59C|nr:ABC transporter ATP-binding protein [Brevibacillus laterosporus]ATO50473.1 ABC transporter ATP-binding protein [Brevibacillus laterosporus DSM 25]MBG9773373.1 ABC transporter ATP-binding protein [Brevibacillus laterosporus]MBG9802809.1 ABC transporter ATP-binding protein [Brevibacillus laterosporus]MED2004817.1 ABC transporter ATP-binding protein [Brevibacillus laterosporus]MED4764320.1 ABC transporter ATP-binding protein [Brevibacillus laterosporus]
MKSRGQQVTSEHKLQQNRDYSTYFNSQETLQKEQNAPVISVCDVSHRYGNQSVLQQVSIEIRAGEWLGIIGPNGSGKSTLLSLMSRAETPSAGQILVYGKDIKSYGRKKLSQHMAVLQQETIPAIHYTVQEVVEMGRFPYQSWWGTETEDSGPFIDSIMDRLQLKKLANKRLDQLSGGQRQRAALAKLMAQSPSIVLLDEPTTYLDIHYQVQFMDVVQEWQQDCGVTVVSVLHDLNLASLYCDRIIVLHDGRISDEGTPTEMMTTKRLSDVFQVNTAIVPHPKTERPQVLVCPKQRSEKLTGE